MQLSFVPKDIEARARTPDAHPIPGNGTNQRKIAEFRKFVGRVLSEAFCNSLRKQGYSAMFALKWLAQAHLSRLFGIVVAVLLISGSPGLAQ